MSAARIDDAVEALTRARNSGEAVDPPADMWGLASLAEAFAIQRGVMAGVGPVGGWKILLGQPMTGAPFPRRLVLPTGADLEWISRADAIELEIAVTFKNVPKRSGYDRGHIVDSLLFHPALEIVGSRFRGAGISKLGQLADCLSAGALVTGEGRGWSEFNFDEAEYVLATDGSSLNADGTGKPGPEAIVDGLVWFLNNQSMLGEVHANQPILTGARVKLDVPLNGGLIQGNIEGLGMVECTLITG